MQVILGLLMAALAGVDETADAYAAPKTVVSRAGVPATKGGPMVAFEIRDIRVSSPEWRGKLILRMQPVTRQEGTAVWSLDTASFKELLELCHSDTKSDVLQAPKMTVRVGDPARMTSEETHQYVASVKRVADGPPNRATKLAFEPQLDKVHNGVRVNILSSQLKGPNLFARVVIDENRLVAIHAVKYTEAVQPKPGVDPEVSRASFLDRLTPNHGPRAAAINATIQVPEVDSRRVEGEWLIPSEGALLVSLGPRALHERGFQQKGYEEHLIA
ncbi:MAG: hypothetical protein JO344_07595, partial [Planctomycetaceae bacterium]|nr:hypothetical protein [Planctomycetaceae bacterium]